MPYETIIWVVANGALFLAICIVEGFTDDIAAHILKTNIESPSTLRRVVYRTLIMLEGVMLFMFFYYIIRGNLPL